MDHAELRKKLAEAREQEAAIDDLVTQGKFHKRVLDLERALAAALGEQYAIPIDFPVSWDCGAPAPHLIASEQRTFLVFLVAEHDRSNQGTERNALGPAEHFTESHALVEFLRGSPVKLGDPNDEVAHGHPLWERGLEFYSAQEVINSSWLAEIESINKVHDAYDPSRWKNLKHYVFWFHDSTFECIATGFRVETFHEPCSEVVSRACERLFEER
ncbi:MAG: hypothetical protein K8T20_14220 [Planctomycetes bacterium]|nr:hypothetical protein [Planctomycetota bacterium]